MNELAARADACLGRPLDTRTHAILRAMWGHIEYTGDFSYTNLEAAAIRAVCHSTDLDIVLDTEAVIGLFLLLVDEKGN